MQELGDRAGEDPEYFDSRGKALCTLLRHGATYLQNHNYPYENPKNVVCLFAAKTIILTAKIPEDIYEDRFVV